MEPDSSYTMFGKEERYNHIFLQRSIEVTPDFLFKSLCGPPAYREPVETSM